MALSMTEQLILLSSDDILSQQGLESFSSVLYIENITIQLTVKLEDNINDQATECIHSRRCGNLFSPFCTWGSQVIVSLPKDPENVYVALTVSIVERRTFLGAMAVSAWIEAMQLKWLGKKQNKDEDSNVIRNKARLVAKGYAQEEGIDFYYHLHQLLAWNAS
ncbi:hypothetical protein Tco_0540524 [Tanacetum coccineum]